jgi:hypothetical protein
MIYKTEDVRLLVAAITKLAYLCLLLLGLFSYCLELSFYSFAEKWRMSMRERVREDQLTFPS